MMAHGEKVLMGLLGLGCVVAASMLLIRWLNPPSLESSIPTVKQASLREFDVSPERPFQAPPLEDYSEIVERPLFLAERRPPEEQQPDILASEAPAESEDLLLLGVVLTPEATMALVQIDEGRQVERVRVGGKINGWQLQSVQPDRVILQSGGRKLDLPLLRNRDNASASNTRGRASRRERSYGAAAQSLPSSSASSIPPYE